METRENEPHEVVVRMVRTEIFDDVERCARARAMLSADELGVLDRLRRAAARRDYLGAHALARTTLADVLHADPARICFHSTAGGRPELTAPRYPEPTVYRPGCIDVKRYEQRLSQGLRRSACEVLQCHNIIER